MWIGTVRLMGGACKDPSAKTRSRCRWSSCLWVGEELVFFCPHCSLVNLEQCQTVCVCLSGRLWGCYWCVLQFTSPCLCTGYCNTHFPFSPVECSSPTLILFTTTAIFGIHSLPQLAARFPLPLAAFPHLLSFHPKWGSTLRLSWSEDVRLGGEASFCLFVLMVEPGGQNPLMAQSRHTRKKQAYYHVFSRSWKILRTPVVDLEHRCFFWINEDASYSVATSKTTPKKLSRPHPSGILVLLVLLIIPLSVEKSVSAISHSLSFRVSHV